MSIHGIDEEKMKRILRSNLSPSDTIKTPERLFGREKNLREIDRAMNSPGRQIFIYGDRGVGKSSLAITAANIHNSSDFPPIILRCTSDIGFYSLIKSLGDAVVSSRDKFEGGQKSGNFSVNVLGVGASFSRGQKNVSIPMPENLNDAFKIVRYAKEQSGEGRLVIVVDEMERIKNSHDREKFAEFIKNIPDIDCDVRFIFCGIASDVSDILGHHVSTSRVLDVIELARLSHDSLWRIIEKTAENLNVKIEKNKLIRIGQISDGFPHYVHLIGEILFWCMFDDEEEVSEVSIAHYRNAIRQALEKTEVILRKQFDKATKKTRNTSDYEEALWALADRLETKRQLKDIYEQSYVKIMLHRVGREKLPKEKFNQRLLALRKESHGEILSGIGSGWFSFRENIMRGYVRLNAEDNGIELGREN